jgi:hypothetical protein
MLQEEFKKAEELAMHFKAYVETEIELFKLRFAEKLSKILSNFLALMVVIGVALLFVLFASLALAFLIGEWLGRISAGFFIVSALYLLMGVFIWKLRERLIRIPILNAILGQLFSNEPAEEKIV